MFVDRRLGNTPRYYLKKPKDWRMRVPNEVCGCVAFVGRIIDKNGQQESVLLGTAFIVSMPTEIDKGIVFLYFVTAKHVADQLSLGGPWFVRMNTKDGDVADLEVQGAEGWRYHPTESDSADVAVACLGMPVQELRYAAIPVSMFATEEIIDKRSIGYGDMVFITGLFTKMTGKKKNIPMVRMGNIAMIPSEKVPGIEIVRDKPTESEVYLIEARSVGGLSGSPVFVRETVYDSAVVGDDDRQMEVLLPGAVHLLGLMHGHWDVKETDINEVQIRAVRKDRLGVNIGIAVVVPAKKILETLNHPDPVRSRQEYAYRRRASEGTTTPD